MNVRRGAAALMAAAATAAPASASAGPQGAVQRNATAGLPLVLPGPARPPQFVVDPDYTGGDGNYLEERVVRSATPMKGFARAHELFHTLDNDQLDMPTRVAIAKILAPRRAHEVTDDASWWGETGEAAGGHAGLAEIAADYYAAAKTGLRLQPRRDGGLLVADQKFAYAANMRPKRLAAFRVFMDQWARRQPPQPKAR